MSLRRRRPARTCPCDCKQRLAEAEALNAAIVRAVVALRPRAASHTVAQGLTGWGVDPADAALLAEAWQRR